MKTRPQCEIIVSLSTVTVVFLEFLFTPFIAFIVAHGDIFHNLFTLVWHYD